MKLKLTSFDELYQDCVEGRRVMCVELVANRFLRKVFTLSLILASNTLKLQVWFYVKKVYFKL